MSLQITVVNVLLTLIYIVPGYILCKIKKASADHLPTLSSILVYVCSPCMIVASFVSLPYSNENLTNMLLFFLASLLIQVGFMALVYGIFHKRMQDAKYRILTLASVMGNVGFFGQPVLLALLPGRPEVMCYSSMFMVSFNLLVFSMGVFCLTGDKKYISLKAAIINPTILGFFAGFVLFLVNSSSFIPDELFNCVQLLGKTTTPLCMFILGIRLGAIPFKPLFTRPIVYLICLGKLVLFPLFAYGCVYFLPFSDIFKSCILILSSVPCATVILGLAEIHHSETELSANSVLVSTLLCAVTMPVILLLL